jgi:ATP-dependent Clp protease protease subunit
MIHQPSIHGHVVGAAADLEIQAKEILRTRDRLIDISVEATKRDRDEIASALDRDKWMTAEEALAFGLLDKIVASADDLGM